MESGSRGDGRAWAVRNSTRARQVQTLAGKVRTFSACFERFFGTISWPNPDIGAITEWEAWGEMSCFERKRRPGIQLGRNLTRRRGGAKQMHVEHGLPSASFARNPNQGDRGFLTRRRGGRGENMI